MSEDIENIIEKPPSILERSRKIYESSYNKFVKWAQEQNAETYTEDLLLQYFLDLSKNMKSSTLWAYYSMIKAELKFKHNIQVDQFPKLLAFLRKRTQGYKPKKSEKFTKEQMEDFLNNAPNDKYLATKVILIFGVIGSCRSDELVRMRVSDVEDLGKLLFVKVRNNPNDSNHVSISRSFTITGDFYLKLYRDYLALRPKDLNSARLFVKYLDGKCHRSVMGINKMHHLSKEVAAYLNLPNQNNYTGYSFRKTSASFLIDNENLHSTYQDPKANNEETVRIKEEFHVEDEEYMDNNMDTDMLLDHVDEIVDNADIGIKMEDCSEDETYEKQKSSDTTKELDSGVISCRSNETIDLVISKGDVKVENCTNCIFNIKIIRNNN